MKNIKKTKFLILSSLIGNYQYGFNIEQVKPVLEKGQVVNSLLGEIPTATTQAAGSEGGPAGFLVHVSNSNLNKLEKACKKFKNSIGV